MGRNIVVGDCFRYLEHTEKAEMKRKHCEPQYGKNKTLSKSLHGMKNRGFNPPKTSVEIEDGNGIKTQFDSMAEAGRFLGKATSLVRYYANNGKQCNGYFIRYAPKE